jgi:SnoaL-like polyketide cyclase.
VDDLAALELAVAYPHFPEPLEGPEASTEMLAQTHHFFPDLAIKVDAVVADRHQALVHWRYRGSFQHGAMLGAEPTGQSVEVTSMSLVERPVA